MNIIKLLLVLLMMNFTALPVFAQEDGWKDIKFGMTLNEVENYYKNSDIYKEVCKPKSLLKFSWKLNKMLNSGEFSQDIYFDKDRHINTYGMKDIVSVMFVCPSNSNHNSNVLENGLYFYKGKFFGKIIKFDFTDSVNSKENEERDLMNDKLKSTFPLGKIVMEYSKGLNKKYTYFEYKSDKITVFNTTWILFFYDSKALNDISKEIERKDLNKKMEIQNGIKKLF